jgi:hypothetical protein
MGKLTDKLKERAHKYRWHLASAAITSSLATLIGAYPYLQEKYQKKVMVPIGWYDSDKDGREEPIVVFPTLLFPSKAKLYLDMGNQRTFENDNYFRAARSQAIVSDYFDLKGLGVTVPSSYNNTNTIDNQVMITILDFNLDGKEDLDISTFNGKWNSKKIFYNVFNN